MVIRKRKKRSDMLIFIFIIAIMLSAYNSYAKYASSVETSSNVDIATWNVKINTEDITSSSVLTNKIQFNVINNNQYVAENKIAPSSEGYFDIKIDTTNAEVAAQYTIDIGLDSITSITGLKIAGYQLISDDSTVPTNIPADLSSVTTNQITGTILLSEQHGQAVNIRVFIKWDDDNTSESNTSHTNTGLNISDLDIPIEILVEQYN